MAVPTITIAAAIGAENGGALSFQVTLSTPSIDAVSVQYRTIGATAGDDVDYFDFGEIGTVTFNPGRRPRSSASLQTTSRTSRPTSTSSSNC